VVAALESALTEAIARAEPSVVAIAREKSEDGVATAVKGRNSEPTHQDPRSRPGRRLPLAADWVSFDYGSGVVIGSRGEILTAYHVVKGARRLEVRATGHQQFEAEIIAADPRSDLAVIVPRDVPGVPPPNLKPITIGDASKLRKGSFLVALGNPFNAAWDGTPSASWGVLANVSRRLVPSDEEIRTRTVQLRHYPSLLQLDSKLNLGMGGGAVINLDGELVGVTTAAASAAGFDAQAGYAIPMDALGRRAAEALRQGKEVEYGFLGVGLDMEEGSNRITSAQAGTPAAEGGLLIDDAITAVNDTPVTDAESLMLAINTLPAGATVRLKVLRQGETLEKTVDLAKFHTTGGVIATNRPAPWRGVRVDYTSMMPNTPFGQELLHAMAQGGVAVVEVEADSPAEKAGLKQGQVIKKVGDQKVRSPRDFAKAVAKLDGPVTLQTDSGAVTIR
jgi:S1-C subfamily serine protease